MITSIRSFTLSAVLVVASASIVLRAQEPPLDRNRASRVADSPLLWYDLKDLGVEGKGWQDTLHFYDRLPGRAKGMVRDPVWELGQQSAGLCARFVTDATRIEARWVLRSSKLALEHMPATGVSGLDLYVRSADGSWRWLAQGRPSQAPLNQKPLVNGLAPGSREFLLYLPLYNGVDSVEIGVLPGAFISRAPARPPDRARPICVYGTSITQGGCASRPGMVHTSILGRRLDREVINLGFSGNGPMELEVGRLLTDIDAAVYVLDCLPNMSEAQVKERAVPMVRMLRLAHPETPIVLVENIVYQNADFLQGRRESYLGKNKALRAAYGSLLAEGEKDLFYVRCDDLLGRDGEATVDGTHPTDLGFLRLADALEPVIREALKVADSARGIGAVDPSGFLHPFIRYRGPSCSHRYDLVATTGMCDRSGIHHGTG